MIVIKFSSLKEIFCMKELILQHSCEVYEPNELTYQTIINSENNVDMYGPFDTIEEMINFINRE